MFQVNLVSIIIPCFNTGKYLYKLLDSILQQDYNYVEVFAVNDGSNDNTEEVIKSYIPKFESRGYRLTYIYQDNSGQSAAINNGLKLVNGEFLMWPDSDDYYCDNSIISRLVKKISSGDYAMGRCRIRYVNEKDDFVRLSLLSKKLQEKNQFDTYVFGLNGVAYPPIAYIIDLKKIDTLIPNREIYTEKRAGQNWQLMMPFSYKQNCFYIEDVGACVLERADSHSRGQFAGFDKTIEKIEVYENTILGTLDRMKTYMGEDYIEYYKRVQKAYIHGRMIVSILHHESQKALFYMKQYKEFEHHISPLTKLACILCVNKYTYMIPRFLLRLTGKQL